MTDKEQLEEIYKKMNSLAKQADEIQDTIAKVELAKNRCRFLDLGDCKYWIKILTIGIDKCSVLELYTDYSEPLVRVQRCQESFSWLLSSIPVLDSIFDAKYKEFLDNVKILLEYNTLSYVLKFLTFFNLEIRRFPYILSVGKFVESQDVYM